MNMFAAFPLKQKRESLDEIRIKREKNKYQNLENSKEMQMQKYRKLFTTKYKKKTLSVPALDLPFYR